MRLRAPKDAGNPSVNGVTIKPDADGLFTVDAAVGLHLIESFGFTDADAPAAKPAAAPPAAPTSTVLHDAVVAGLKSLGVVIAGMPTDDVLAAALTKAVNSVNDQMIAAVKRAEDDVLAKLTEHSAGNQSGAAVTSTAQPAQPSTGASGG